MTPEEKAGFATERVSKKLELDAARRQNFSVPASLVTGIAAEGRAVRREQFEELLRLTVAFYRPHGARDRNTSGYGLGL